MESKKIKKRGTDFAPKGIGGRTGSELGKGAGGEGERVGGRNFCVCLLVGDIYPSIVFWCLIETNKYKNNNNMLRSALLIAFSVHVAVAPFSCPGAEQGCANDQVCCNDDSKCYDIATAFDSCKFSCTTLTEDGANLPCFDSKSRRNKCFGKTCSNNGDCFEGKCFCNIGFAGDDCEKVACVNDCHNHGKCESGICQCHAGFAGLDCRHKVCPEGCSGHGQCKVGLTGQGSCECTIRWEGGGCGEPGCPSAVEESKCSGHGECVADGEPHDFNRRWACKCSSGWSGADCSQPACPNDCGGRGECLNGKCICKSSFGGEGCELKNLCGSNCERLNKKYGYCDEEKLECICKKGWEGFDCLYEAQGPCNGNNCGRSGEAEPCMNDCTGPKHGTCVDAVCRCKPGFYGPDCSSRTCPGDCSGRGTCDDKTGECKCSDDFVGIDCSKPACPKHCSKNGVCDKDSKCNCNPPFMGSDCSKKACATGKDGLECSGIGRCGEDGHCECPTGRTGHACSREYCLNDCSGHGMCLKAKCYCDDSWEGADCGEKSCPNDCSDRGVCVKKSGKCTCNEGYFGASCEHSECGVDCGINGHCDSRTKKCKCVDGFGGVGCQTTAGDEKSPVAKNTEEKSDSKVNRFKRVSAKIESKHTLTSCSSGCAASCGKEASSLGREDIASFTTKCNMDCVKKCMK